jgi:hypothetical protein
MQNSSRAILWIILIIIVIAAIVYGVSRNGRDTDGLENNDVGANTTPASITLMDQFPGKVVYVGGATLPNGGFVVIHKSENGAPGAIVGSSYFPAGVNPGTVELTESTVDGSTYYAMLHSDDGDRVFDAAKDLPLKNAAGEIVMRMFTATKDLPEIKG